MTDERIMELVGTVPLYNRSGVDGLIEWVRDRGKAAASG